MVANAVGSAAAGPSLIRTINERLVLRHIRAAGELSRPDLARLTQLSKPTIGLTLANLERSGLVRQSGVRTGIPGPAAVLYEVRPEAGYVLGLDVGNQYLRGAICDLSGAIRARETVKVEASSGSGLVSELAGLAELLYAKAAVPRAALTQTVLGTPGVYDPVHKTLSLTGALPGWERPQTLTALTGAFGATLMVENDIDAAALAERAAGHGRDVDSFAFVSIGTGIGMGLVLGGELHRGAHGAAGEIGYLSVDVVGTDPQDARRRGPLEAAASAAGVVRAAKRAGLNRPGSARRVFTAAAEGDERAAEVVAAEASLVARAIASIVAVVDPQLVVLGGGIGQAAGFIDAVRAELPKYAPVLPSLRVSALGDDAVVDGCLAAGLERAWELVTAAAAP